MKTKSLLFALLLSLAANSLSAANITVTTADNFLNDGITVAPGSLLAALQSVAANDTIRFNIAGDGPHVIATPQDGYPFITADNVTLDGYSQPGSVPNTNPILGGNNARIKIILDSRDGPEQRTKLGPLNNPGYGDSESAILAVLGAKNFHVRGLSFLSRHTDASDTDPDIYCLAFVNDATGGRIQGCWLGLHPDGATVAGGRASVASFKGDNGTTSAGMVIGTDGDGVNDRAEFNVHVGMGLAIHLETDSVKVSGNYINVYPDGNTFYDVETLHADIGDVEAIENGFGHNMVIGTDGDGVADADERNIIGPTVYSRTMEFWRTATNVVVAGNYFGVGVDGVSTSPYTATRNPDFVQMRSGSSIRIGSNGDGVSDDLEGNRIYNVPGTHFVDAGASVSIVTRLNKFVNNNFLGIPFAVAENGRNYIGYYSAVLAGPLTADSDAVPVLTDGFGGYLSGVIPAPGADYPYATVDIYVLDPVAASQLPGLLHPRTYLGSLVDDSVIDLDPNPGAFTFDLNGFNIPAGSLLAVAVTYSKVPGGSPAGQAVTSPLSVPFVLDATIHGNPNLLVTTASNFQDDGVTVAPGSLLEALQILKSGDTIGFDLPGNEPHVIATPQDGYPFITADNVTLDGYSQPGSSPNTNPILGGNNAKIKIILDSRDGPEQRTKLGPLNNPGYGDSESAILAVLGAKNFHVRGLSFLSRHTDASDTDPDIYCLAFVNDATGGRIQGCWLGLHPDSVTVSGGRASVASFKGDNGTTSAGMVIGTDGDGVNDRAEFNVHMGMGLAIHLETDSVKVSGNYINVYPDGNTFYDVEALHALIGDVESLENGFGHNMVIGTDGDGVADADERNIFGPSVYNRTLEFWRKANNVVVAGNYFGVGVDGMSISPFFHSRNPDFVQMRNDSSIRIGSNGDGVSDDLEGNRFYNVPGSHFVDANASVSIVARRNIMVNDYFAGFPFADLENGRPYVGYYANALAGPLSVSSDAQPILSDAFNGLLSGTLPPQNLDNYARAVVDVYLLDPVSLTLNPPRTLPGRYLGSFVEGSTQDLDPNPDAFLFDLNTFSIPLDSQVVVSVTYSKDPKATQAGRALTGPLSNPVTVDVIDGAAPAAPTLHIARSGGNAVLGWRAGEGLFRLESADAIAPANWGAVPAFAAFGGGLNAVSLPVEAAANKFFRLVYER